mmetsp:Transcript_2447/g.8670  ORF Transcript_2447/g.8670 Transcript_2447/m.8670 type:complete len:285 (+) Transcript_2447:422-1276(+)
MTADATRTAPSDVSPESNVRILMSRPPKRIKNTSASDACATMSASSERMGERRMWSTIARNEMSMPAASCPGLPGSMKMSTPVSSSLRISSTTSNHQHSVWYEEKSWPHRRMASASSAPSESSPPSATNFSSPRTTFFSAHARSSSATSVASTPSAPSSRSVLSPSPPSALTSERISRAKLEHASRVGRAAYSCDSRVISSSSCADGFAATADALSPASATSSTPFASARERLRRAMVGTPWRTIAARNSAGMPTTYSTTPSPAMLLAAACSAVPHSTCMSAAR